MLLAGDIGGAKTDLALCPPEAGPQSLLRVAEFASQDCAILEVMARAFLSTLDVKVEAAGFAIAGPVIGSAVKTMDLPWPIEAHALAASLGVASVYLLDDMEAMAHAMPLLQPQDLSTIVEGAQVIAGSIAIIAPATGLGEAHRGSDASYVSSGGLIGSKHDIEPWEVTPGSKDMIITSDGAREGTVKSLHKAGRS